MQVFTNVLLIIILFLLILDVIYLRKISKSPISRTRNTFDKRFFELKFEIRVIEVVAAILLFVGTFLGVSTLNEIKEETKTDLENEIRVLREETKSLESIVQEYQQSLDSLKSEEGQSIENLNDIRQEFATINKKVAKTQEALKYTPQIYVVENLRYNRIEARKKGIGRGLKFYFKDLKTIYGEALPKFSSIPIISLQGNGAEFVIVEKTKDYFEIQLYVSSGNQSSDDYVSFDVWLVSLN